MRDAARARFSAPPLASFSAFAEAFCFSAFTQKCQYFVTWPE
jgi:hypothetical protein